MILRSFVKRLAPQFLKNWRWKRTADRHRAIARALAQKQPFVHSGPFCQMRYIQDAAGSMLGPKLLGTYEMEISEVIERILSSDYQLAVDVGAAEGYYAVGLLYKNPSLVVNAYDTNTRTHALQRQLAELNDVEERLSVLGEFDPNGEETVEKLSSLRSVMIVDIDGGEDPLLNPDKYPILRSIDILVETHDCYVPGITEQLVARFNGSHQIERYKSRKRLLSDLPPLSDFTDEERLELANEHRPNQEWLWMKTKHGLPKP